MSTRLHLLITTPATVLVDDKCISAVRATDSSGSFGLLPGHVDLITVLLDSVIRWRDDTDHQHYCAVRRGVLMVSSGNTVRIACREGMTGENLAELEQRVRDLRSQEVDADREETMHQMRLHTRAMRQIMEYINPANAGLAAPPSIVHSSTTGVRRP